MDIKKDILDKIPFDINLYKNKDSFDIELSRDHLDGCDILLLSATKDDLTQLNSLIEILEIFKQEIIK